MVEGGGVAPSPGNAVWVVLGVVGEGRGLCVVEVVGHGWTMRSCGVVAAAGVVVSSSPPRPGAQRPDPPLALYFPPELTKGSKQCTSL